MYVKHEIKLPKDMPKFFYRGFARLEELGRACDGKDDYEWIINTKKYNAFYNGFMAGVKSACYDDRLISEGTLDLIILKYASAKPVAEKKKRWFEFWKREA